MKNMLVEPTKEEADDFAPAFTILNAGCFPANRYVDGMTSSCSVDLHLGRGEMVILGTQYAGEMKKGILTLMMYMMPLRNQLARGSAWGFFVTDVPCASAAGTRLTVRANALNPSTKSTPELVLDGERVGGNVCDSPFPYVTTAADCAASSSL